MKRNVWIDGERVALAPSALFGQGGEAEVYDLGDGRVVKWWKPPDHPDFVGLPDAQRQHRIQADHQRHGRQHPVQDRGPVRVVQPAPARPINQVDQRQRAGQEHDQVVLAAL